MTKRRARWLQLTHEIFTHPWLTDLLPPPHHPHTATYPHDLSEVFAGMDKGREERSSNPASPSIRYRATQRRTHSPHTPSDSPIHAYNHPNSLPLNRKTPTRPAKKVSGAGRPDTRTSGRLRDVNTPQPPQSPSLPSTHNCHQPHDRVDLTPARCRCRTRVREFGERDPAQFLVNADELVPLRGTFTAGDRADLHDVGTPADGEVRHRDILSFT